MSLEVRLVVDAEQDLLDLTRYVARHDSMGSAEKLLDRLQASCLSLQDQPERGHVPPELERIGVASYREIVVGPYRIIYRISERWVLVHAVLDGRRDLADLLQWRLVRS